jgi:hypothetical protein
MAVELSAAKLVPLKSEGTGILLTRNEARDTMAYRISLGTFGTSQHALIDATVDGYALGLDEFE